MSNYFTFNNFRTLGFILIVGLAIGLVTPVASAEAPESKSYISLSTTVSLHGHIASIFKKDAKVTEVIVDGLTQEERAAKIEQFFRSRDNSPMADYAMDFVKAADKYEIDWKLLAAISTIESNGGQMACKFADGKLKHNAFGWGGCKISFDSYESAIDHVTKNLAGLDPKTARHYGDKTISQIIDKYNPPSIREDYNYLVTWAMKKIASTEVSPSANEIAMK